MKHIIICGIPGSGKTTKAKELKEYYVKKGKKVAVYSRDEFRKAWFPQYMEKSGMNREELYQWSFKDSYINGIIKEDFYNRIVDGLELKDDIHIYDMTNISRKDAYFWFEFATYAKAKGDKFKFYEMDGNYKSTHGVPEDVMEKYKKEREENAKLWFYLQEYIEDF